MIRVRHLAACPLAFLFLVPWGGSVAAPDGDPQPETGPAPRTVTNRFTARVARVHGVLPFPPGTPIEGTVTYDLDSRARFPAHPQNIMDSPHNALSFRVGDLRFVGAGRVSVTSIADNHYDFFTLVAEGATLPAGWESDPGAVHKGHHNTFGILLQNVPPRGVIPPGAVIDHLDLPAFVNTREFRMDFIDGVRFPGGQTNKRAMLSADLLSLERVP